MTGATQQVQIDGFEKQIFVTRKDHLPVPIGGVITLLEGYTYYFCDHVDLTGDRIVCIGINCILGTSSETASIKSTGLLGQALITSYYTLPIRSITFEADIALNLNGAGADNNLPFSDKALDWFGVNFTNCNTVGTVKNYSNFIATDCALLNSQGLTFDDTIGTIGFFQNIFDCRTGGTMIIIPSTAIITRRFRVIYSAFVVLSGETGINISNLASIPIESYILDTVNFSGGGTYTSGLSYNDNKALFISCKGLNNSASIAQYFMINNTTATIITATNTFTKIAGATSSGTFVEKFTLTDNRATYIGAITGFFKITSTISCQAGNGQLLLIRIAKNGTTIPASESQATTSGNGRSENIVTHTIVELSTNDYIELFCANGTTNANITVTELNVIAEKLN